LEQELIETIETIFEIVEYILEILELSYKLSTIVFAIGLLKYFQIKSK
jgi:hypothetical protein